MLLEDLVDDVQRRTAEPAPATLHKAALCVLDTVGCALGGHALPWARAARETCLAPGAATVWGDSTLRAPLDAVYANSVMAHSIVQEDMHPASRSHMGTVVVPAALAFAEVAGATGDTVLRATVAGYEAMAHIGELLTTESFIARGMRPTGYFGPFGAAMAASVVLGLSRDQTVSALGLAASSGSGTCEWAFSGTVDCFFQNGSAARAGAHAALLASQGVRGSTSVLEGRAGLMPLFAAPRRNHLEPRSVLAVDECYFKAYPSCAFTQEAIEGARILRSEGVTAESVRSVVVRTYRMGKEYPGCDNATSLESPLARQMSTQFGVAAMWIDGEVALDRFTGPLGEDVAHLAATVTVEEDPAASAVYPTARAVEVVATVAGGARRSTRVTAGAELRDHEVVAKFRRYAGGRLTPAAVADVIEDVGGLAGLKDVAGLSAALRPKPAIV